MLIIATHDVADVQHWFESPKRAEFFGPRGIQATAFRDPAGGTKTCSVLIDTPDLETFQKALAEPEAAEAEAYDGVDPDTIQIFVAE
jgi:hypothetical protein